MIDFLKHSHRGLVPLSSAAMLGILAACAPVGPDFVRPDAAINDQWPDYVHDEFHFVAQDSVA